MVLARIVVSLSYCGTAARGRRRVRGEQLPGAGVRRSNNVSFPVLNSYNPVIGLAAHNAIGIIHGPPGNGAFGIDIGTPRRQTGGLLHALPDLVVG